MATNKKCIVCGKKYEYSHNKSEQWESNFCSSKCRQIFDVASRYSFGHIDEAQAKIRLKNLGITDKGSCPSGVLETLVPVFAQAQPKPSKNTKQ